MGSARSKSLIIAALGAACILIAAGLIIAIVLASKGDHPPKPTSASSESGREATPSQQLASEQPATTAQQVSPVVARSAQAGVPLLPPLENGPGEERQEYFTKGRLLQRQGQFERALQYYQKSAESAASPALRSAAILSQAELLFRQRRHAEAIDVLQGAVAILEDDARVRALILKGRCLSQQQRHEEAAACCEEVVRSGTEKARVDMAQTAEAGAAFRAASENFGPAATIWAQAKYNESTAPAGDGATVEAHASPIVEAMRAVDRECDPATFGAVADVLGWETANDLQRAMALAYLAEPDEAAIRECWRALAPGIIAAQERLGPALPEGKAKALAGALLRLHALCS